MQTTGLFDVVDRRQFFKSALGAGFRDPQEWSPTRNCGASTIPWVTFLNSARQCLSVERLLDGGDMVKVGFMHRRSYTTGKTGGCPRGCSSVTTAFDCSFMCKNATEPLGGTQGQDVMSKTHCCCESAQFEERQIIRTTPL